MSKETNGSSIAFVDTFHVKFRMVAEIANYIDYYNNWRPQVGLGRMTPVEFREYLLAKPICLPVPVAAARENGDPSLGIPVSQ